MAGRGRLLALLLAALLGGAACGGGGKPAGQAPATPSLPATPSTPSTATATTFVPGVPGANFPPATPVNSPAYRNAYIRSAVEAGIPTSLAPQIADCVIAKLQMQGIKTVGDVAPHQAQFASDVRECARRVAGG